MRSLTLALLIVVSSIASPPDCKWPQALPPGEKLIQKAKQIAHGYPHVTEWLNEDPINGAPAIVALHQMPGQEIAKLEWTKSGAWKKELFKPSRPPDTWKFEDALAKFAARGIHPQVLPVGPVSTKVKDVPFGSFKYHQQSYDYAQVPVEAKRLTNDGGMIYFGRGAKSAEDARKIAIRYFTQGVERDEKGAHFDIHRHQSDIPSKADNSVTGSANSGFTNGSEVLDAAESFARKRDGFGIVFVTDVRGLEILNLNPWYTHHLKERNGFDQEQEVLFKGGRSPKRVRAAIVYEDGLPVAILTNPNYEPGGGK